MAFLSKKNADMLYEVVSEEFVNVDYGSFNKLFLEFGESVAQSQIPVMELNKRFVRTLQAQYQQQRFLQQQQQQQQHHHQQQTHPSSSMMPSRPQGARSKNVTFDQELELHKQHFQQFAAPPPPAPPVFKDAFDQPADDLSMLMKKAMSERNYDAMPPPPPIRKLQIGSVIEDEKHKEDMIDIDKLLQKSNDLPSIPSPPLPPPLPPSSASSFDFFSKLKVVKPATEFQTQPSFPDINPDPEMDPLIIKQETLIHSTDISTNALEVLTQKVSILTEELQSVKELVVTLSTELEAVKKHYIPELKETPTLQDK